MAERGVPLRELDDLLGEQHLCRRVALTVPTLALALRTVAAHELITIAPRMLTGDALPRSLRTYPLPAPTPAVPAVLAWHTRHDRDAAHRWLRTLISDSLAAIAHGQDAASTAPAAESTDGSADTV